jgi:hypothetical protein
VFTAGSTELRIVQLRFVPQTTGVICFTALTGSALYFDSVDTTAVTVGNCTSVL